MMHAKTAFSAALSACPPTPRTEVRDIAFRKHIVAPRAESLISLDAEPTEAESIAVRNLLKGARNIHDQLCAKNHLPTVAASTTNLSAFAIGQLLHNAFRKELIVAKMTPHEVFDAVLQHDTLTKPGTMLSRQRFINALRALGIISHDRRDRDLKMAGTTPSLRTIGALIEEHSKIRFANICSPSRARPTVRARFETIWVLRHVCGHSLSMIGEQMGGRDHTTILNSINKLALKIETDISYQNSMEMLCERADMLGIMHNRMILLRQLPN